MASRSGSHRRRRRRRHRARDDPSSPAPLRRHGQLAALAPGERGPVGAAPRPPPREGNALEVLIDGANALPAMAEAIRGAHRHVHICSWHLAAATSTRAATRASPPMRELLGRARPSASRCACSCGRARRCRSSSRAAARSGRARRARARHEDPVRARRPRPADALPPREARDRRRRGGVRRRHRPDRAGRRPLRLQRAPAQGGGDRLARRVARGCAGRSSRDVAAHFALRWEAVTRRGARACPSTPAPAGDTTVQFVRTCPRAPTTCSRAASSRSWRPTSARCAARAG